MSASPPPTKFDTIARAVAANTDLKTELGNWAGERSWW